MQDVERAAIPPPGSFPLEDITGDSLLVLANPDNLERWASATTFLQITDPRGYVLSKSFNLGMLGFPAPPQLTPNDPMDLREAVLGSRRFLVLSRLLVAGPRAVVVQIGEPLDEVERAFAQTREVIAVILVAAILAVTVLSFVLASEATNPINELARAMREIRSDRLNRRIQWKGRQDEIGNLAETFDDLLARLEEAFARERQFISDASHELKTPLTSINANAQLLARWGDRDEAIRKESLETIVKESASLAEIVTGMLTLSKADSGDAIPKEPLVLSAVAGEAAAATAQRAAEKGLTLEVDAVDANVRILGDPALIRQMIGNLVDNAIKFTEQGGVTVRVRSTADDAIVEVQDTGPGIDPEELPMVFDRFYRTDKSRSRAVPGTGLGLAIVRSIARVHDGRVEAARAESGGAIFRVRFPKIT